MRTGVTAILPHGGDIWREKVPAAGFAMNGNGEVTGLSWLNEQGALTMTGRDGVPARGIPVDRLLAILRAHGALAAPAR